MSSFSEPLSYRSTDRFVGGHTRHTVIDTDEGPEPATELVGARRVVEITRPFTYTCPRTGCDVTIDYGFATDLGSIPAIARVFLSPDDPWAQAYVVHDWHYDRQIVERRVADAILWDALGVPFRAYTSDDPPPDEEPRRVICPAIYRWAIWLAVRIGGRYRRMHPAGAASSPPAA